MKVYIKKKIVYGEKNDSWIKCDSELILCFIYKIN